MSTETKNSAPAARNAFDLFPNQPDLVPAEKGLWRLDRDWKIRLPCSRRVLRIAAGFMTDGASIPRLLWPIVGHPFDPVRMAPALAHDALYAAELMPRAGADEEFFELLLKNDDTTPDAAVCWAGVRAGGWWSWVFQHSKKSVEQARQFCALDMPPALCGGPRPPGAGASAVQRPAATSSTYGWSILDGAQNAAAMRAVSAHVAANPQCNWCGNARIAELTAHHIIPVHTDPDLAADDTNLVTLCAHSCHLTVGHLNNWHRANAHLPRQLFDGKGVQP